MKKVIILITVFLAFLNVGFALNSNEQDSLRHELSIAKNDSSRASILLRLSQNYRANRPDSSIFYANKALILARAINSPKIEINAMTQITLSQIQLGNESGALQIVLEAIKIAERNDLIAQTPGLFMQLGMIYEMSNNYPKTLNEFRKTRAIADSTNDIFFNILSLSRMAETFSKMNQIDSALYYGHLAYDYAQKLDSTNTFPQYALGITYFKKRNYEFALKYFHEALQFPLNKNRTFERLYQISLVYHQLGIPDSSTWYANKALEISLEGKIYSSIIEASTLLSEIYEKQNMVKALQFNKSAIAYRDTLDNLRRNTTLEAYTDFDKQERQFEIDAARKEYKSKVLRLWILSITGALLSALLVAFILYRNNKNKQKANALLNQQKEEIQETLTQLKATQAQLIQSEKMASLGELTAGIAHEIQNPLNFVNNFSEVNSELITELKEEIEKGDKNEAIHIANDIAENEQKIIHHGKRADAIVKGMLQHSRTSTGQKEFTDINALADEYLRLTYHGLRAKDKSFNVDFQTDFDPTLPKINVIPQDIGRVLLNLINNAFYVVDKKAKENLEDYKPEVIVRSSSSKSPSGDLGVKISVKDNGPGIPSPIVDKIFQPFFTTKPTGQGTGLGLSLSYDIVKAHGGEIKVESKEGEGSEFIVQLPANNTKK